MAQPLIILEWISELTQGEIIVGHLSSPDILLVQITKYPLPTGCVRYHAMIDVVNDRSKSVLMLIQEEINRIMVTPLLFTFNIISVSSAHRMKLSQGLRNIIGGYLWSKYNLPVSVVNQKYVDSSQVLLQPMDQDGYGFYMTQQEQNVIIQSNFDHVVGFDLVSTDPLVWMYLDSASNGQWGIRSWNGLALIPITPMGKEDTTMDTSSLDEIFVNSSQDMNKITLTGDRWRDRDLFIAETNLFVSSLRERQYFGLTLQPDEIEIGRDLAQMWSIDYLGSFKDRSNDLMEEVHVFKPNIVLDFAVEVWFRQAITWIKLDRLPICCTGGNWSGTINDITRLQDIGIRAYNQVGKTLNPILCDYTDLLRCLPNLSFLGAFTSLREVTAFKDLVTKYLNDGDEESVTQANGRVELHQPQISFRRVEDHSSVYSFYLDEVHPLFVVSTDDPNRIYSHLSQDNLFSPWGRSYLRYYPLTNYHRHHLMSEKGLLKRYSTSV